MVEKAAATAAAKLHSDTGQTGAATDGERGAARAAKGAKSFLKIYSYRWSTIDGAGDM